MSKEMRQQIDKFNNFKLTESENLNISDVSESKKITKDEFIDEFLDRLYMNGTKDDGKYILTLSQATSAANEIYNEFFNSH